MILLQGNVMSLNINEKLDVLDGFIELTSDRVIREAAYPRDEWVENGGNTANGLFSGINNYSIVSIQDSPPLITPKTTGLLSQYLYNVNPDPVKQDIHKRSKNIAHHLLKVQAHPCFKQFNISSNPSLDFAVSTFKKKAKRLDAPQGLKSDLALFKFYNLYAQYIEMFLIFDDCGFRQPYANAKLLTQAKRHIEKLQIDFRAGLRLNNNHYQLESLLRQLSIEIDQAPRKDKETPTASKRRTLENFAHTSIVVFGEISSTILGYFAEILGWDNPSNSTMDEIVLTAKKKHRKKLIEILKK